VLIGVALLCASLAARVEDVHVMVSGGFTAAYRVLVPPFEQANGAHVETALGPSMGSAPTAIPVRLSRGEPAEVVIMVRTALDNLVKSGQVVAGSEVDLARSRIGMAVRKGAPVPDIGSVTALKRALLAAASVAYADSASGVYISGEMFKRLGIEREMALKARKIQATPVGEIVAQGGAEIGFQQMSELAPISGITLVGPIPEEVQLITVFSAGLVAKSAAPEAGRALIRFLSSRDACGAIERTLMEPVACARPGK
jgi:molybdate transport system substrate-binding protein